jgi:hypothetical protein
LLLLLLLLLLLQIPVPQNRMTPLKTSWLQLYTPITDNLKLDMRMNLKTRKVSSHGLRSNKGVLVQQQLNSQQPHLQHSHTAASDVPRKLDMRINLKTRKVRRGATSMLAVSSGCSSSSSSSMRRGVTSMLAASCAGGSIIRSMRSSSVCSVATANKDANAGAAAGAGAAATWPLHT